jgi:tRNA pseudouridine55 synthase
MNGIICVYKPSGYTSFDVIAIMRRLMNTKKIGHSGTLDPMAEGVLPVFAGAATKAVDFCPDTDKEYRAAFKIGYTTDTQDSTGRILSEAGKCFVPRPRIEKAVKRFIGEIEQIPPMYSAVKVDGKRLYQLARKGIEVERKSRKITVHEIKLEEYDSGSGEGVLRVACSKGTYIRTLIHDMGQELAFGAVMTALQRSMSNGFTLDDCHTLDTLRSVYARNPEHLTELMTPIDRLFSDYPRADLDETQTRLFSNGVVLNADLVRVDKVYDGLYSLFDCNGRMVALAQIARDHSISIVQRFHYGQEQPNDAKQEQSTE